jgi:protein-L-isoaspartate(D-aspartate) O-methyltransferase
MFGFFVVESSWRLQMSFPVGSTCFPFFLAVVFLCLMSRPAFLLSRAALSAVHPPYSHRNTERLDAAFARIHRADFLPASERTFAAMDSALPIGHGQTNSQPYTVHRMLELLDVAPGQRILDVGCGSGWTTALLGDLVGPEGQVVGVEIVPELVTFGRANLAAYSMAWTSIEQARADVLGVPERAPYDRILVSAEASEMPLTLLDQLRVGGVMVVPILGQMTIVRRTTGEPQVTHAGLYSFVRLIEPF